MISFQNIDRLKNDLVKIYNLKNFLVDIPTYHPDSPKYQKLWSEYMKYCIEGYWGKDGKGYRFMPPVLFFYANFFKILHFDDETKTRKKIKPKVRDIDWHIQYAYLESQGFSGFDQDEEYTCNIKAKNWNKDRLPKGNELNMFNSDGKLKKFISAYEYLRKLHNQPLGKPLYNNAAKNLMIFGSRGSGKSYTVTGICAHTLTFDGIKYFTKETIENPPTASICIGAGSSEKSADLISKITAGLNFFGTEKDLGVWGDVTSEDFTPNPFYRDWAGTVNPGNKKNPFRYEYDVQTPAGWVTKGTGTNMVHVNYSDKKQGGAEAAAGGRYVLSVYEEVGLQPNFIDALLSNSATVTGEAEQMGVQIALGTSGNIDLVQQSKKVFNNPEEYNFLSVDDIWEDNGRIGLFIPAYLSDTTFKDENGNTDIDKALKHFYDERVRLSEMNDPDLLRMYKMNYPIVPSDMWISSKGHYFPILECMDREKELVHNNLFEKIGSTVNLIWDSNYPYGVKSVYDSESEPFYEFPYNRSMGTIEGAIRIFEEPNYIKGEIPNDMYLFTLDPYVAENIDDGGSLGVLYGFLNPKYSSEGYNGNYMVCSYIGKHKDGKDAFYENVEKLLAYYGNPNRGLWYEANRGDSVRGFFIRKKKTNLLCLRPTKERGTSAFQKNVVDYGVLVSNRIAKLDMIGDTSEWLLSKTVYNGKEKRVVETIPCIFTIRQLIGYTLEQDSNFDAVSSLIIFPLALKELEHFQHEKIKQKRNEVSFLSINPFIFKNDKNHEQFRKSNIWNK